MPEEKQPQDQMIPIRDGRGNFLSIGSEVVYTGISKMTHMVGRVIGFDPGGMSIVETNDSKPKQTMARVRVIFDMTLTLSPQYPQLMDIFRIVNPDSETILAKILDPSLQPKVQ